MKVFLLQVQEAHCNPNERDFDGATPLHFAASCGQTKVVEWLLQVGECNITVDRTGATPLHNAAEIGQLQVSIGIGFPVAELIMFQQLITIDDNMKNSVEDIPQRYSCLFWNKLLLLAYIH